MLLMRTTDCSEDLVSWWSCCCRFDQSLWCAQGSKQPRTILPWHASLVAYIIVCSGCCKSCVQKSLCKHNRLAMYPGSCQDPHLRCRLREVGHKGMTATPSWPMQCRQPTGVCQAGSCFIGAGYAICVNNSYCGRSIKSSQVRTVGRWLLQGT